MSKEINKELDTYEPFGDEWKKEVGKLPKPMLIEQWKQSCLKRQEAEKRIEALEQLLRIAKCPEILIKNPEGLSAEPTAEDIKWATEVMHRQPVSEDNQQELWEQVRDDIYKNRLSLKDISEKYYLIPKPVK